MYHSVLVWSPRGKTNSHVNSMTTQQKRAIEKERETLQMTNSTQLCKLLSICDPYEFNWTLLIARCCLPPALVRFHSPSQILVIALIKLISILYMQTNLRDYELADYYISQNVFLLIHTHTCTHTHKLCTLTTLTNFPVDCAPKSLQCAHYYNELLSVLSNTTDLLEIQCRCCHTRVQDAKSSAPWSARPANRDPPHHIDSRLLLWFSSR